MSKLHWIVTNLRTGEAIISFAKQCDAWEWLAGVHEFERGGFRVSPNWS